jgi:hypothetical protein
MEPIMVATVVLGGVCAVLLAVVVYLLHYQRVLMERLTNPPKNYLQEQILRLAKKNGTVLSALGETGQGAQAPDNPPYLETDRSI